MSGFGVFTLVVLSGLPFCSEGFTCFCLNITCSTVINQFAMELDLPAQKLVLFFRGGVLSANFRTGEIILFRMCSNSFVQQKRKFVVGQFLLCFLCGEFWFKMHQTVNILIRTFQLWAVVDETERHSKRHQTVQL